MILDDEQAAVDGMTRDLTEIDTGAAPATARNLPAIVLETTPDGAIVLPEGAVLSRVEARGIDLVIITQDGTQFIVPGGAIDVPQIVVEGVTIPAINVAALLVGNEPQPAAGPPQSSGGNFAADPGSIQSAYGIGDLLPYTELQGGVSPMRTALRLTQPTPCPASFRP